MTSRPDDHAEDAPLDDSPFVKLLRGVERARKLTVWTFIALIVGTSAAWSQAPRIFEFLARPLTAALTARDLDARLVITGLTDPFILYFTVSLFAGLLVALPLLTLQLWIILAPRLPTRGVVAASAFVVSGIVLFFAGAAFCQFVLLPFTISYLLDVGAEFEHAITVRDFLRFSLRLLIALGLAAQLPLLSFSAARVGIVTPRAMWKAFPYSVLVAFILSAWITPPDGLSQVLVAVPLVLLYLLGIAVAWVASRKRRNGD